MKDRGGGQASGAEVTISCLRKGKRTFYPTGNTRLLFCQKRFNFERISCKLHYGNYLIIQHEKLAISAILAFMYLMNHFYINSKMVRNIETLVIEVNFKVKRLNYLMLGT